jgi:hypothetical protein
MASSLSTASVTSRSSIPPSRTKRRARTGAGGRKPQGLLAGFEFAGDRGHRGVGRGRSAFFFFFGAAAHFPEQEDGGEHEQDADEGDLCHRVFVQLLSHTFA